VPAALPLCLPLCPCACRSAPVPAALPLCLPLCPCACRSANVSAAAPAVAAPPGGGRQPLPAARAAGRPREVRTRLTPVATSDQDHGGLARGGGCHGDGRGRPDAGRRAHADTLAGAGGCTRAGHGRRRCGRDGAGLRGDHSRARRGCVGLALGGGRGPRPVVDVALAPLRRGVAARSLKANWQAAGPGGGGALEALHDCAAYAKQVPPSNPECGRVPGPRLVVVIGGVAGPGEVPGVQVGDRGDQSGEREGGHVVEVQRCLGKGHGGRPECGRVLVPRLVGSNAGPGGGPGVSIEVRSGRAGARRCGHVVFTQRFLVKGHGGRRPCAGGPRAERSTTFDGARVAGGVRRRANGGRRVGARGVLVPNRGSPRLPPFLARLEARTG